MNRLNNIERPNPNDWAKKETEPQPIDCPNCQTEVKPIAYGYGHIWHCPVCKKIVKNAGPALTEADREQICQQGI